MEIRRDLHNLIALAVAVNTTAVVDGEDVVGNIIDRDGAQALEIVLQSGAYTDGSVTPLVEHGDESDLSDAAAVPDELLLGTEADAALTGANQVKKVGYIGDKKYVRVTLVTAAGTTMTAGAVAVRSAMHLTPDLG